MITVDVIHSSPVKSLSLLQHHSTHVGFNGIEGDREFYLVNADGRIVTQREFGKLVLVRATYSADQDSLRMVFPDGLIVESPLIQGRKIVTRIWDRQVTGFILHGDWSKALSYFCGFPVSLVQSEIRGQCFDEYPVSLLSDSSVQALDLSPIDIRRFRPSLCLKGVEAFEEDTWLGSNLQIGDNLVVQIAARDPRCSIVCNDPNNGQADDDILMRVKTVREGPYLGVYGLIVRPGIVTVGDKALII
ncbi:MAG: MOSC N-terminal beta barrel domain-containing protein [Chloroflexota bacterium]|nr:MOSC N-terminal beta barrel domain-containing protein [Chloroflexota bacterium]